MVNDHRNIHDHFQNPSKTKFLEDINASQINLKGDKLTQVGRGFLNYEKFAQYLIYNM